MLMVLSLGVLDSYISPWFSFMRKSAGSDGVIKYHLMFKRGNRALQLHPVRQMGTQWIIPFIWNSRKWKQIYRDRNPVISCWWWYRMGGAGQGDYKGDEEAFGGDGSVHTLDCSDSFIRVYKWQNKINWTP